MWICFAASATTVFHMKLLLKKIRSKIASIRLLMHMARNARYIRDIEVMLRRKDHELLKLQHAYDEIEQELRKMEFDEASARAQLMQLRVHGMSIEGRTGYAVTAFIPEEVNERMRNSHKEVQNSFAHVIALELVSRALKQLWNVNSRGAVSATIFNHLGDRSEAMPIFDSDRRRLYAHESETGQRLLT